VLFHPHEPYVATSGVERHVILHSPFKATPAFGKLTRTETRVRELAENNSAPRRVFVDGLLNRPGEAENDENDEDVINLFDE
jgi:WD repeat-containing protein 22